MPSHPDTTPTKRILCVDDEPTLRETLALHLRRNSYHVETAPDGMTAFQLISNDPTRFQVVITDNQMPHLSGIDLVEKLQSINFPGKILFFSSTLPAQSAERLKRLGVHAVIEKGRPVSELLDALRRAFEK